MNDLPTNQNVGFLSGNRRRVSEDSSQGLGFAQPKHVSRMGGRFSLVDETGAMTGCGGFDQQIGVYLDMVIVDANPNKSKLFYDASKPYDPNSSEPPICFSDNGVGASVNAISPQSTSCAQCQWNKIGSAISNFSGAAVRACRDQKKLAVMVAGGQGVWLFTVPPASLKEYRNYLDWASKQALPGAGRNADVSDLITRVYFDQEQPNVLKFRCTGLITPQIAKLEDQLWSSGATDDIVGRADMPVGAAAPIPGLPDPGTGTKSSWSGTPPRSAIVGYAPQPMLPAAPPPPPAPATAAAGFGSLQGNGQQPNLQGPQPRRRTKKQQTQQQPQPQQPQAPFDVGGAAPAPATSPPQAAASTASPSDPGEIPQFLQRPGAPPPPKPAAAPAPQQPQFGIAPAAQPDQGIVQAVADAFKL